MLNKRQANASPCQTPFLTVMGSDNVLYLNSTFYIVHSCHQVQKNVDFSISRIIKQDNHTTAAHEFIPPVMRENPGILHESKVHFDQYVIYT